MPKTRWQNLKGERAATFKHKVIKGGLGRMKFGETNYDDMDQMANCIRRVAKEVCRESKGKRNSDKEFDGRV